MVSTHLKKYSSKWESSPKLDMNIFKKNMKPNHLSKPFGWHPPLGLPIPPYPTAVLVETSVCNPSATRFGGVSLLSWRFFKQPRKTFPTVGRSPTKKPLKLSSRFQKIPKKRAEKSPELPLEVAKQTSDFLKKNISELKAIRSYLRISGKGDNL